MRESEGSPVIWLQEESQLDEWLDETASIDSQEITNDVSIHTNAQINQNNPAIKRTADERSPIGTNNHRIPQVVKKSKKETIKSEPNQRICLQ